MNIQRIGLVLLTGLAFGSSAVMSRIGLAEIPPFILVMLRFLVGLLGFIVILAIIRPQLPHEPRVWFDLAFIGAGTVGLPLVGFTTALLHVSTGVTTIIIALIPLFTALMIHWGNREPVNRVMAFGLILGLAGVVFVIVTGTNGLSEGGTTDIRWHLLALVSAIASAFGIVYTRRRLQGTDPYVATAGQIGFALLGVAPFALTLNTLDISTVTLRGWFAVLYIGVIGSTIAFLLTFLIIKRYGATTGALPGYIVPIVASALGALLLGELITLPLVSGGTLILLGVFLASQ